MPIVVKHKGLGVEVLRATVYDGEVHLPGADLFYINEVYEVEVPETIRTMVASAAVMIQPSTTIAGSDGTGAAGAATLCTIPLHRPSRRVR